MAFGFFLLVLLGLSLVSGFRPLYVLLYTMAIGSGLGFLWAWLQGRGLEVKAESLDAYPQVGQPLHLRITLREKIGVPRIGLRAGLSGKRFPATEAVVDLGPRGTASWTVVVEDHHRGVNSVGSLAAISSDPLGLVRLEREVGEPHSVTVYPSTVPLSPWSSVGYGAMGEREQLSRLANYGISAARVREYVPGDNLNHIHWPTTARLDQLMTKEFDGGGRNEEVWLFVDLHSGSQAGAGTQSTEEYAIIIAASLAKALLDVGEPVGLMTKGDTLYRIAPNRGPEHLKELLKALALVTATGTTPLAALVAKESRWLGQGSALVVIAPWSGQDMAGVFDDCYQRDITVVPIFTDAASFDQENAAPLEGDGRREVTDGAYLIRLGDNLKHSLSNVMEQLVE